MPCEDCKDNEALQIRSAALDQAMRLTTLHMNQYGVSYEPKEVLQTAKKFERYLRKGEMPR